ncbi:ATP-binding protein [Streptomyces sp. RPT161]|uniref:ATP-binding protein n=1 Tax=Streptomyces sp. RPT161 TaxID=3015993 RepID=UPI0022B8DF89|nr:ATP-binding protein [Streptomyces sp. RPT161]
MLGYLPHMLATRLLTMQLRQMDATGAVAVRRWSRRPQCVGLARAELRTTLAGWGLEELAEVSTLVLSELLTNAVRHAHVSPGREIETRFMRTRRGTRLEVHDASERRPEKRPPALDAVNGRGLSLVASLADSWGVEPRAGVGKVVWAEINAPESGR